MDDLWNIAAVPDGSCRSVPNAPTAELTGVTSVIKG